MYWEVRKEAVDEKRKWNQLENKKERGPQSRGALGIWGRKQPQATCMGASERAWVGQGVVSTRGAGEKGFGAAWNLAANSKNQPTVANRRGSGWGMTSTEGSQRPFTAQKEPNSKLEIQQAPGLQNSQTCSPLTAFTPHPQQKKALSLSPFQAFVIGFQKSRDSSSIYSKLVVSLAPWMILQSATHTS